MIADKNTLRKFKLLSVLFGLLLATGAVVAEGNVTATLNSFTDSSTSGNLTFVTGG